MSFASGGSKYDYNAQKNQLEQDRLAKLAKQRKESQAEGALTVRRQQRSPTVLTNPLGLGDQTLG